MEKRFHDPCPERGIGEEDMLATVCRGTCVQILQHLFTCTRSMAIMSLIHCIHLGVALILCFGACKDSHSPPTVALILLEWHNS